MLVLEMLLLLKNVNIRLFTPALHVPEAILVPVLAGALRRGKAALDLYYRGRSKGEGNLHQAQTHASG